MKLLLLNQPRNPHVFFFFNDTATTEIYTLSLHDALPISKARSRWPSRKTSPPSDRNERRRELQRVAKIRQATTLPMSFDELNRVPHRRFNPLLREWVQIGRAHV